MKLFVCLWALFAVANAGLIGLGGGRHGHGPAHGRSFSYGAQPTKIFRVKVINEGFEPGPQSPQPSFALSSNQIPYDAPPRVIQVIHHQAPIPAASSVSAALGPVSTPVQVIKLVHEHHAANAGSLATSGSSIQPQIVGPAQVIRIIHEVAAAQSPVPAASTPSATASTPNNDYLPPLQTPAQYLPPVQQYDAPSQNFIAPEPAPATSHIPAQTYGVP